MPVLGRRLLRLKRTGRSPALFLKSAGVGIFRTGAGFGCIFLDNDSTCKMLKFPSRCDVHVLLDSMRTFRRDLLHIGLI